MCTVTIVPTFGPAGVRSGIRVACNRDESRGRPAALRPIEKTFSRHRALMPVDTVSGGTWIAVNDAGLVLTLLNQNPGDMRGITFLDKTSRGGIIPALLYADTLTEACELARDIDVSIYPPFRLVMADTAYCIVMSGDGGVSTTHREPISAPIFFTSSGLGDALVEAPRRELFHSLFDDDSSAWAQNQDAFHRHHWKDRPELSVDMSREDATTVSLTLVELSRDYTTLTYHPASPSVHAEDSTLRLPPANQVKP